MCIRKPKVSAPPPPPPAPPPPPKVEDPAVKEAGSKEKRRIADRKGRSSTILTGPSGVTGEANSGKKTLLGQ